MGLTTKRPGVFEHHRATQPMWPNHADAAPAFGVEELAEEAMGARGSSSGWGWDELGPQEELGELPHWTARF